MDKFYSSRIFLILHIIYFIPNGIRGNQHCVHTSRQLYCCNEYGENYYEDASFACYGIKDLRNELFLQYSSSDVSNSYTAFFLNSSITKIPSLAFHTFSGLRILYLNHTGITTMEMGAFVGLTKLEELHLENNNISEIDTGTLNHLLKLSILILSDNKIENLDKHTFKDLANLKRLYLNKNKLTKLEEDIFSSLAKANEIDLSQNYLHTLNFSVFNFLSELKLLNLSGNQIQSLSPSLFKDLTKLNVLDLSKNLLSSIPYGILSGLNEIEYLNISYNRLTVIDSKSLYSLQYLTELNLAGNSLSYLDAEELTSIFTKLKHIHLHENSWTCDTLFAILKAFRMADVVVELGNTYQSDNLHAIHCIPLTSHLNEVSMTLSNNEAKTNLTSTIKGNQVQLYYLHLSNILMEISEKISKNNNIIEKFVEVVQYSKMQNMINSINVTFYNTSLLSNKHELDAIENINQIILNLQSILNTTDRGDVIIELVEAKHLLERISRNSEQMVSLQESIYQRQFQLNNDNATHATIYNDNTNTSTYTVNIDTFMRKISDSIALLHSKIGQLTTFRSSDQHKSELLRTERTSASQVNGNTSTLVICLSISVVILLIILGFVCFRNGKYNILARVRRFTSDSRHNKSEIDLMNNSDNVFSTQI